MLSPAKKSFALGAALLLLCGCAAYRGNFDRIATHLEPGGSCYSVTDFSTVKKRAALCDEEFADAVLHHTEVPLEKRREFFRRRALVRMTWYLAGLDMVQGWGKSSVCRKGVSADDPVPVRNRFFAAMPTDNERGINGLFSKKNSDFRRALAELPDGVGVVLWGELRPSSLNSVLKNSGAAAGKFDGLMEFLTTFPLKGSNGSWLLAASPLPQATLNSFAGWRLKLEVPDAEGKLFSALSMMLGATPEKGRIAVPAVAPGLAPVVLCRNGKLIVCNSADAEAYFENSPSKLTASARFAALTADLPDDGIFFGYVDENCIPKWDDTFAGISLRFSTKASGSFLLRRENDGWLWVENSSMDWNEQKMLLWLNLIDLFGGESVCRLTGLVQPPAAPEQKEKMEMPEPSAAHGTSCEQPLKKIASALERYAADHQGSYPAADGKAGLAELCRAGWLSPDDCRCAGSKAGEKEFCYFGGLKRQQEVKVPVVIDRGHGGFFHVIFSDGTFRRFQLERADSMVRIVSFLHTQYHWDERIFRMLMAKAAQFDRKR